MVEEPKVTPLQPEIPTSEAQVGETIVHFTKSNFYRVIHVDGIYGGPTPTPGNIMITVFNSRVPLPDKTANDALNREIPQKRVGKQGIEQEAEASLVMNLETAKGMHAWLESVIRNAEILLQQFQKRNQGK